MDKSRNSERNRNRGKSYDHNNPVRICSVCSTLGDWHCYECSKDFCGSHFTNHKEKQLCVAH